MYEVINALSGEEIRGAEVTAGYYMGLLPTTGLLREKGGPAAAARGPFEQ